MRRFPYVQVDVFSARALEGNALAVFTDARGLSDAELQAIARETNLSETTFVLPDPAAPPGASDLADFNIVGLNTPQTVNLNANQAAAGLLVVGGIVTGDDNAPVRRHAAAIDTGGPIPVIDDRRR